MAELSSTKIYGQLKIFDNQEIDGNLNVNGDITGQNLNVSNWDGQYNHSIITTGNPHSIDKQDVGLSNVPNTNIAYSTTIAADDFTQTEVNNLRQAKLDDGTTPWTAKLDQTHAGQTGQAHGVVSTSVNGFMSQTDKVKLNGIQDSANNYTDQQAVSAVQAQDDYVKNTGDTITGNLTITGKLTQKGTIQEVNSSNNPDTSKNIYIIKYNLDDYHNGQQQPSYSNDGDIFYKIEEIYA